MPMMNEFQQLWKIFSLHSRGLILFLSICLSALYPRHIFFYQECRKHELNHNSRWQFDFCYQSFIELLWFKPFLKMSWGSRSFSPPYIILTGLNKQTKSKFPTITTSWFEIGMFNKKTRAFWIVISKPCGITPCHISIGSQCKLTEFGCQNRDVVPFGSFSVQSLQCADGPIVGIDVKQSLQVCVAINGVSKKQEWR